MRGAKRRSNLVLQPDRVGECVGEANLGLKTFRFSNCVGEANLGLQTFGFANCVGEANLGLKTFRFSNCVGEANLVFPFPKDEIATASLTGSLAMTEVGIDTPDFVAS